MYHENGYTDRFCKGDAHVQFASAGGIIAASDTSRECIEGDATTHVFLLYDFCNFPARTIKLGLMIDLKIAKVGND